MLEYRPILVPANAGAGIVADEQCLGETVRAKTREARGAVA
jgi:hypothetical protein